MINSKTELKCIVYMWMEYSHLNCNCDKIHNVHNWIMLLSLLLVNEVDYQLDFKHDWMRNVLTSGLCL